MVDRALQLEGVREKHKQDEQSGWQSIMLASWNRNHAHMCGYSDRSATPHTSMCAAHVWRSAIDVALAVHHP
jgi:hypothetical protein